MVIIVTEAASVAVPMFNLNLGTMSTLSFTSPPSSSSLCLRKSLQPFSLSSSLPSSSLNFPYPNLSPFLSLSPSLSKSHSTKSFASSSSSSLLSSTFPNKSRPTSVSTFALVDDEEPFAGVLTSVDSTGDDDSLDDGSVPDNNVVKHCELDVCNLPRNFGISELHDLFKPYGTVQSVEVSRNAETGISRGCGSLTMSSMAEAKAAIAALDGSDVGGREMRVRFSVDKDVDVERRYFEPLKTRPNKNLIFETPYKMYVGNLEWRVKPGDLKTLFSKFGTVNSARVLHDRKGGKNRVYGFLSFSSPAECKAAASLDGTEFFGRKMLIREVGKKNYP